MKQQQKPTTSVKVPHREIYFLHIKTETLSKMVAILVSRSIVVKVHELF